MTSGMAYFFARWAAPANLARRHARIPRRRREYAAAPAAACSAAARCGQTREMLGHGDVAAAWRRASRSPRRFPAGQSWLSLHMTTDGGGRSGRGFSLASPVSYVSPAAPPVLIIHGTADLLVPFAQSAELAAALESAGVPHDLVPVDGAGHGFAGAGLDPVVRRSVTFLARVLRPSPDLRPGTPGRPAGGA